ncbi:MAG: bifunctional nuclease family protein [Saprospiraceae bacterium]|uniref:Bifunctional nuclease family protein n=1 Tax=Candidatus Defluviibacterium haderslevense TaxID=2981993 RepID=A0A9D7SCJ9_9BACT|nr:bifunctional nuclease family protein [Candidatus Defluviibacterium haderslevense]MBL0235334.1 bifunctional nuclease family protein [Candidatus Defluviibacterium haderslevense]
MKKVELEIIALSHSVTQTQNYAVVLGELNGNRRLPIVIGGFEAQAIAVVLERMNPNRPLTHDLFKNAMSAFGVDIKEVVINDLVDGIFFSKLICEKDGEIIEIDSRTSDALAMAVRFNCTVSTFEFVMEQAGVILEESEESLKKSTTKKIKSSQSYDRLSSEELQTMLAQVLTDEDYEKAAKIRDELNRRK